MAFTEKEMREDLHKVRIRKYLYLGGGLLILALGLALFVISITKRDWAALVLAVIGFFWSIMLFYHYMRTRDLEAFIRRRSEGARDEGESVAGAGETEAAEPDTTACDAVGRRPGGGCAG
jgi:hypothetical protein